MSWDVVVFKLNRKVSSVEEIDETVLVDIGTYATFTALLKRRYPNIVRDDRWVTIHGTDHSMETTLGADEATFTNTIFHLSGEHAVYELIELCKAHDLQAFDAALGQMLDLEHPERNGYEHHQRYVEQVTKRAGQ